MRKALKIAVLYDGQVGIEIMEWLAGYELHVGSELRYCTVDQWKDFDAEIAARVCPSWLKDFKPDWLITAWWPKILTPEVIASAKHTLNTHNSFLPWNRGKHPNFWSIAEQTPYGVSLHEITPAVDAGRIYARKGIEVEWSDTGETLHKRSLHETVDFFKRMWPFIRTGKRKPIDQGKRATFHRASDIEAARTIDLDAPTTARKLLNVIRAGDAYGHTATFRDGALIYSVTVKIKEVEP